MKRCFGNWEFKNLGPNALKHGRQADWTDCGILVANTIAHDIYGGEIWTTKHKTFAQVRWFVNLCDAHLKDVCLCCYDLLVLILTLPSGKYE